MNASGAFVDLFCFHVIRCITIQLPVVDVLRYRGNSAGFRPWACPLPFVMFLVTFHLNSKVGCYNFGRKNFLCAVWIVGIGKGVVQDLIPMLHVLQETKHPVRPLGKFPAAKRRFEALPRPLFHSLHAPRKARVKARPKQNHTASSYRIYLEAAATERTHLLVVIFVCSLDPWEWALKLANSTTNIFACSISRYNVMKVNRISLENSKNKDRRELLMGIYSNRQLCHHVSNCRQRASCLCCCGRPAAHVVGGVLAQRLRLGVPAALSCWIAEWKVCELHSSFIKACVYVEVTNTSQQLVWRKTANG